MRSFLGLLILCACMVIGSPVLSQQPAKADLPPGVTIDKPKWETFITTSSNGSILGTPGSNPNRLPLPTDASAVRIERTEVHAYSIELSNDGPKAIKAFAWDFIFVDPGTSVEQLRHSFANVQKIGIGQKKTARFTTALSPPKVVNAAAAAKDPTTSFRQYASIQCILFADDTTWEQPQAKGKPCERLKRWIEERKKSRPGLEDFPFNP